PRIHPTPPCPTSRSSDLAAPTAGLHFTPEILRQLRARGVAVAELDLHVGPGTFKPVEVDDLTRHAMHAEAYVVSQETAAVINERRRTGGQVWAVGTTVVRTLETGAQPNGTIKPGAGDTALFIHAPYEFLADDRLLTNFQDRKSVV